jgi:hypothetical protein
MMPRAADQPVWNSCKKNCERSLSGDALHVSSSAGGPSMTAKELPEVGLLAKFFAVV